MPFLCGRAKSLADLGKMNQAERKTNDALSAPLRHRGSG